MIAAAVLVAIAMPASSQTRLRLREGFTPDPTIIDVSQQPDSRGPLSWFSVELWQGGPLDTVEVSYSGSGNTPLHIYAATNIDSLITVRLPNGEQIGNDDMQGLNPGLTIDNPQSGTYVITLASFQQESIIGQIGISEVAPFFEMGGMSNEQFGYGSDPYGSDGYGSDPYGADPYGPGAEGADDFVDYSVQYAAVVPLTIRLNDSMGNWEVVGNEVVYYPDMGRRVSNPRTYMFPFINFMEFTNGGSIQNIEVMVGITAETRSPQEAYAHRQDSARPEGGFTDIVYEAEILEVIGN